MLNFDLVEDADGATYPPVVQRAAKNVLAHMGGCPDPECRACEMRRAELVGLIHLVDHAVREALQSRSR